MANVIESWQSSADAITEQHINCWKRHIIP